MTETTKEIAMKPFDLFLRLEDSTYIAIKITNSTVQYTNKVIQEKDNSYVCDCAHFRFKGECYHIKVITSPFGFVEFLKDEKPVYLPPGSSIETFTVNDVLIHYNDVAYKIKAPDLNVLQVESYFIKKSLLSFPKPGQLNPTRIYQECLNAFSKRVPIYNKTVIEFGAKVKPLEVCPELPIEKTVDIEETSFTIPTDATERRKKLLDNPLWKVTPRPNPKQFYVAPDVWETILECIQYADSFLLIGQKGTGKSELLSIAAKITNWPIEILNCGAMSEPRTTLVGNIHFSKEKGTHFEESQFLKAFQVEDCMIVLDEITRIDRSAGNILLPAMDRQAYISVDEAEPAYKVKRANNVFFAATANVGMEYTGTDQLDAAIIDRFSHIIHIDFVPPNYEIEILLNRCPGLTKEHAKKLISIAEKQRDEYKKSHFTTAISTRMLIAAGKSIGRGRNFGIACESSIVNHFKHEGEETSEQAQMKEIIRKFK